MAESSEDPEYKLTVTLWLKPGADQSPEDALFAKLGNLADELTVIVDAVEEWHPEG